jgi:hypothetical protein
MTAAASARSSSGAHCEQLLSSELSDLSGGTPRGCVPISLARLARQMAYEVKWDGFRAIVSTEGPLRVRSRRGWDMTEHVRFLEQLPVRAPAHGQARAFDKPPH